MSLYGHKATHGSNACLCDLRSDTLTSPDEAMRAAMASATVGDDVYGEDPSVNALEQQVADLLGKEAAVFFPSGTQSNLAAVMAHCGRGDEVIIGDKYHIYCDEAAGASVLGGVSLNAVPTNSDGSLSPDVVIAAIKADDPHYARSKLLCLENTVGGMAIPLQDMQTVAQTARGSGLAIHLDGARLFNAILEIDCSAQDLAACADSVSVCMSKGLGAPAGSVLVGTNALIARARRNRKILGGSMRQSGILAAAALYALDHNICELKRDHENAAKLATELKSLEAGKVVLGTNMVFFTPRDGQPDKLRDHMADAGVRIGGQSPAIRMVMHRDVGEHGLEVVVAAFRSYFKRS